MIIEQIRAIAKPGVVIPKPEAKSDFIVKGWGKRRGEEALIYYIPNHENRDRLNEKGVNVSEWEQAHSRVMSGEDFSRQWFEKNMTACFEEGACNFTTIGGIFQLLGLVDYERGAYKLCRTRKT
jgi:hypothetical protein